MDLCSHSQTSSFQKCISGNHLKFSCFHIRSLKKHGHISAAFLIRNKLQSGIAISNICKPCFLDDPGLYFSNSRYVCQLVFDCCRSLINFRKSFCKCAFLIQQISGHQQMILRHRHDAEATEAHTNDQQTDSISCQTLLHIPKHFQEQQLYHSSSSAFSGCSFFSTRIT